MVVRTGHRSSLRARSGCPGSLRAVTGVATPEWARHLPAGVDPARSTSLARRSLPAAWARTGPRPPTRPRCTATTGGSRTRELDDRSRGVAGRLAGAGLRAGDRVVMSAGTSTELVVAHVAALRLGLVVVPVNGAYRAARDRPHRRRLRARRVHRRRRPRRPASRPATPDGCVVVTARRSSSPTSSRRRSTPPRATTSHCSATRRARPARPRAPCSPTGTCSRAARRCGSRGAGAPSDRLVLALPLFHVHGLGVGLHGTLLCGASAVLLPHFDGELVLDAARDDDAHPVLRRADDVRAPRRERRASRELARLRLCVSGSAPLPATLHDDLATRAGITGARALRDDRDDHERLEPLRRRAACGHGGLPAPGGGGAPRRPVGRDPAARPERVPRLLGPRGGDAARRSPPTAGSAPATSAPTIPTATSASSVAPRSSSSRAATTCTRARSRTSCSSYPRWRRSRWSGSRPTSGARWSSPSSCPRPASATPTRCSRSRPSTSRRYKRPRLVRYVDALPRNALGQGRPRPSSERDRATVLIVLSGRQDQDVEHGHPPVLIRPSPIPPFPEPRWDRALVFPPRGRTGGGTVSRRAPGGRSRPRTGRRCPSPPRR